MNQRELRRALSPEKMEAAWDEVLSSWTLGSPEEVTEARTFVAREYEDLQQALMDVDDADERASLLTHYYIRLKAQWLTANTQIGYQMAGGRHNEKLFYQNSLLSTLIAAIEPFVEPPIARRLEAFLSDPSGEIKAALQEEAAQKTLAGVNAAVSEAGTEPGEREAELLRQVRALSDTVSTLRMEMATLQAENARLDDSLADQEVRMPSLSYGAGDPSLNGHDPSYAAAAPAGDTSRLREALDAARREAATLRAQLESVLREAGADSPSAAVAALRERSDRAHALEMELRRDAADRDVLRSVLGGDHGPREVAEQVRRMRVALEQLESEAGPATLLREQLCRELGTADPVQVLGIVRESRDQALALRQQLERYVADREYLTRETGRAEAAQIVALLREFHDAITAMQAERAQWEADVADLEAAAGTRSAREAAEQIRQMKAQLDTLQGVADLLSNMDEALATVG